MAGARGIERVRRRCDGLRATLGEVPPAPPTALADLSPRELDVLHRAAAGLTNREIGAELYLSEHTVRNYLSTVFTKLGVRRRSEAAALVARLQAGSPS